MWWGRKSKCGDVDGDGVEEVIWSLSGHIAVYDGLGPHQFERVGSWWNHGSNDLSVNIHDINHDGYNEIICSGGNYTYVLGLEAVKVKSPNGGEAFRPGDSVTARWQRFEPPSCDSMNLFLSLDNGSTYDTLATGIAPRDTSLVWVVPDSPSDSCLIQAMVYGPGWRADESDSVFRIVSEGVAEERSRPRQAFGLVTCPNPMTGETYLSFGPWQTGSSNLSIFDSNGRLVRDLTSAVSSLGSGCIRWDGKDARGSQVPPGVYLVRYRTGASSMVRKLVRQ